MKKLTIAVVFIFVDLKENSSYNANHTGVYAAVNMFLREVFKRDHRSIFEQVKEQTNITAAARFYGVAVDRQGRGLCPFHDDHHPSMSFKHNRFTCFACGAKGSVIDLVMQIFHISPLEAAVRIQEDFHLRVEVRAQNVKTNPGAAKGDTHTNSEKGPTNGTESAWRASKPTNGTDQTGRMAAPTDSTEAILTEALRDQLADMEEDFGRQHRELCENTVKYAPDKSIETVSDLYAEAAFQLPVVSGYLDILDHGSPAEKLDLYRAYKRKELTVCITDHTSKKRSKQ